MDYPTDHALAELHEILIKGATGKTGINTTWRRIRSWSNKNDNRDEWRADFNRRAGEALNGRDGWLATSISVLTGKPLPRADRESLRDWISSPIASDDGASPKARKFKRQNRTLFAAYARLLAVERSCIRSTNYYCSGFAHELASHCLSLDDLPLGFSGNGKTLAQLADSIQQSRIGSKPRQRDSLSPEVKSLLTDFPRLSELQLWWKLHASAGRDKYLRVIGIDDQDILKWRNDRGAVVDLAYSGFQSLVRRTKNRLRKK